MEDKMKFRILGMLLTVFALILIIFDGYAALKHNDWMWKSEVNRIKSEMMKDTQNEDSTQNKPDYNPYPANKPNLQKK